MESQPQNTEFRINPENFHPWIMDESFQDYSWIQDFEADFQQKVSLKMLN